MNKFSAILILLLGLLLAPSDSYACGKGASHACKKEKKAVTDSCCGKKQGGEPCKGKCGHSSCGCTTIVTAIAMAGNDYIPLSRIASPSQKSGFSYAAPSVSDGFFTIWLIPKIS